MGKRKICRIVERGLQITGVTSLAIGFIPCLFDRYDKETLILTTGIGIASFVGSHFPHTTLYRLKCRDDILEAKKNSDTYKISLEKEEDKFDRFGMYLINRTINWTEEETNQIYKDYDIDMEILDYKKRLLTAYDEELIDFYYDQIDRLNSIIKSEMYEDFKNSFYKNNNHKVLEFKTTSEENVEETKTLKLINKLKKKTSNDDKE